MTTDRSKKVYENDELEKKILVGYANGKDFKQIGEQLGINFQTVEACLKRLGVRIKDASQLKRKKVYENKSTALIERINMLEQIIVDLKKQVNQ